MKTLNDFSAFKLNKNQMGAMKGGNITCNVNYTDGFGGSFTITYEQQGISPDQARDWLSGQHKEASSIDCYELNV